MKRLTALLLAIVLCFSVSACSSSNSSSSADQNTQKSQSSQADSTEESLPAAVSDEPYTLYFLHQASQDAPQTQAVEAVIRAYQNEVDPNMEYQAEYIPDTESYYSKLKTLIASDEMPSMFWADPDTFTSGLRDQGLLYNVGDMLEDLDLLDYFLDITIEYPKFDDGSLYGMAVGANVSYFFYHPSMFKAAGIDSAPATWDEFLEDCSKIKETGITPIASSGDTWYVLRWAAFMPFRMSGNDYIMNAISGNSSWYTDEAVAMGDFFSQVTQYWPEGWAGIDGTTARDLFTSNQAAMWYYPASSAIAYVTDEDLNLLDDIDFFLLPTLEGYDATAPGDCFANSGKAIHMSNKYMTENEEVKRDFIDYFVKNFGNAATANKFCSGIIAEDQSGLSDFQIRLYEDFANVSSDNYAACWDVVIDSVSNEILKAETINLALGDITIEEWCQIMDDAIAANVG